MRRTRGLTHEEILKELQRLDEMDSGDSDISDLDIDEEYVPTKNNNSDSESDNSLESDSESCESNNSDNERSETNPQVSEIKKQKRGRGRTRDVFSGTSSKRRRKNSDKKTLPSFGKEEISNDGTLWKVISPSGIQGRCAAQNVVKETKGPTSYAKRKISEGSVLSAWRLIFSNQMIRHIKECTEEEARRRLSNNSWTVSFDELEAVFSIMYARGLYGAKNIPLNALWSTVWGAPFFSQTMSRDRFKEIIRFLRFDHKTERSERLKSDKFALASALWYPFIENCGSCYKPGINLTVDEQLLPSKARCPFTQYIPSKPDKFGIKFWMLVCVDSKYVLNGFPYTGADTERPADQAVHEHVVIKLTQPYLRTGRNVTTDSYFTTVKLCEKLKSQSTSLVGTLRRDRREVPPTAKLGKQNLYSTVLYRNSNDITLTSYQGKKTKNVLLLSSLHNTVMIENNEKRKPETVSYYNQTKYGVDIVDQMIRLYSTKSGSRRWPMHVFFNVLDISAINAWILYKEVTGKKNLSRRNFILQLCEELRTPYMSSRNSANERKLTDQCVNKCDTTEKRVKCKVKICCKGNHTWNACQKCKKAVCGKCASREVRCIICHENCTK